MIILEIKVLMIIFPALENDNLNNELIKTNHLLYIVNNSNLDSNRKKYFEYWIKNIIKIIVYLIMYRNLLIS